MLRWAGGECLIREGESIALPGGQTYDITNRMGADGSYRAHWLAWDDTLIAAHADAHPDAAIIRQALPITDRNAGFAASMRRASAAVDDSSIPDAIARHRLQEVLVWIGTTAVRGHHRAA